jgi:hypothetical protein
MRTGIRILLLTALVILSGRTAAAQTARQDTLKELLRQVEILTGELEKAKLGKVAEEEGYERKFGMGPAASRVYQLKTAGISISGYGEVVYQNFAPEQDNGTPAATRDAIDYLRHITYLGFRFNDWLLFNSEIEFEHAKTGEGSPGEVAVEFGYIEAEISPALNLKAGMMLVPVGIINELHEPPTYHGALRPESEQRIIPSTWRGNGFGLVGTTQTGIGYKLYVIESLNAAAISSNGVRSGRQNGAQAVAENMALTGRLNYTGIPGLDVGGSFFLGKTGQGLTDANGSEIDAGYTLMSLHALFARRGLELRGFFATSSISDVTELNGALGLNGSSSVGESQSGYYITAAYDIMPHLSAGTVHYLAPFVQYESFDTQSDVPGGFSRNPARERTNLTVGATYKPHPNVALKVDFINRTDEAESAVDQFNVAVNYLF